ncbi:hypothetical protein SAY87_031235 [Trapa incisa]|uniref:Uncharacterized protein n=1 Tax=Trapa incisa TaxID=236973 RepID=A0AAN7QMU1_9MYRT|nr:hypothetical protein SAY87_031235 [Trapa incisa]
MDHCARSTFLLTLLLLFVNVSSAETFRLPHQVQKIAAASSHLDHGMNHFNQRGITVSGQMKVRKLMMAMDAILDYDRPKPNPRHDDKGKPGGG